MEQKLEHQENNLTQPEPRYSSRFIYVFIFMFIVLMGALGLSGYCLMTLTQRFDDENIKFSQIEKETSSLKQANTDLQHSLQAMQSQLTENQKLVGELQSVTMGNKEEWNVLEAKHLVQSANDALQAGANIPLVLNLLQTADKRLSNLSDPKVASIRKALAQDIATLQAMPQVDSVGIYMQLAALNTELDKLPFPSKQATEQSATDTVPTEKTKWWKRGLQQSWEKLNQIVIVRHHQPGVRPFISPDDQAYLYQNLHALILQAMSAVLYKQQEIYDSSLSQASVWVKQYFLQDSTVTQSVQDNLAKLQAIKIHADLPSISASLQAFNDYFSTSAQAVEAPAKDTTTEATTKQ